MAVVVPRIAGTDDECPVVFQLRVVEVFLLLVQLLFLLGA